MICLVSLLSQYIPDTLYIHLVNLPDHHRERVTPENTIQVWGALVTRYGKIFWGSG